MTDFFNMTGPSLSNISHMGFTKTCSETLVSYFLDEGKKSSEDIYISCWCYTL